MKFIPFHRYWLRADDIEGVGLGLARSTEQSPVVVYMRGGATFTTDPLSPDDATVEIRRVLRLLGNRELPPAPVAQVPQ